MSTVLTTPDGLIALLLLVIFPLALVGFALWVESGRSAYKRGGGGEIVIIEAARTLLLVVLLSSLPSLVNGLSSIVQFITLPDGGGWIVQPNFTFLVGPIAWVVIVLLVVRRVLAIRAWLAAHNV
ncbi:MAG: hypothetical protein AAF903_14935 [Pseudomonadota bacterium]